jgi:hypothetical protein
MRSQHISFHSVCVHHIIVLIIINEEFHFISVLHPYFKLHYIKLAWGGPEEQAAERAAGNHNAKNWHEEALGVIENAVSSHSHILLAFNIERRHDFR